MWKYAPCSTCEVQGDNGWLALPEDVARGLKEVWGAEHAGFNGGKSLG